jgi:hypothetical protein
MILGDVPSLHELNVLIFDLANDFLERFADDMEHCTHLQRTRIRQSCFHLAAKAIHNNERIRQGHARQNLNELKFELSKLKLKAKREQMLAKNVKSVNKSVNLCNSFTPPPPPPPPLPKPGPPTEFDLAFDRFVAANTAKAEAAAAAEAEAEAANPTPKPTPTPQPTPSPTTPTPTTTPTSPSKTTHPPFSLDDLRLSPFHNQRRHRPTYCH